LSFAQCLYPQYQGAKLASNPTSAGDPSTFQGSSSCLSSDGNTLAVGGYGDNFDVGSVWIYMRTSNGWSPTGTKLTYSSSFTGIAYFGYSCSFSGNGFTLAIGAPADNNFRGSVLVFTRSSLTSPTFTFQQKIVGSFGTSATTHQGTSVSLSFDGNTLAFGGPGDGTNEGSVWVQFRSNSNELFLHQQRITATPFLLKSAGSSNAVYLGNSVSLTSDGNTLAIGGHADYSSNAPHTGAVWIFARSGVAWGFQAKLIGSGSNRNSQFPFVQQGYALSFSADGNTLAVGGNADYAYRGSVWIFTKSAGSSWTSTTGGTKLYGTGYVTSLVNQGTSVCLSADGLTLAVGGINDYSSLGAVWIFSRATTTAAFTQAGTKLVGNGYLGSSIYQGYSCSLSSNGDTLAVGGPGDAGEKGAVWIFNA